METKTDKIRVELDSLRREDGTLHAPDVWQWAKKHKDSVLHTQFPWDVRRAAEMCWTDIARRLIRVHVEVADQTPLEVRSFVSLSEDRKRGGGYRGINDVLENEAWKLNMIRDALNEFKRVKAKYLHLKELTGIFEEIEAAETKYAAPVQQSEQAPA